MNQHGSEPAGPAAPPRPAAWRAELLKISSLRSTVVLASTAVATSMLVSGLVSHADDPPRPGDSQSPLATSFGGLILAEILIAALGALAATSDYSSNTIRAALIAFPQRGRLYLAKLGACAVLVGAVALAATAGSLVVGQWILHGTDAALTASTPHLPRVLLGAVYYLLGWGLAGFGIGLAVRRTAPAIGVVVVVLWVLPGLLSVYDLTLSNYVAPTATGQELLTTAATIAGEPGVPGAALSFTCFILLCLAFGWQSFRRDT